MKGGNSSRSRTSRGPAARRKRLMLVAALAGLLSAPAAYLFFHAKGRPESKPAPATTLVIAGSDAGYVDAAACAGCHRQIWETYRHTGMARSLARPRSENTIEDYKTNNTFYHRASDRHYKMYRKDGKYYQRRHQVGFDGRETNVVEKEIHFVMGSGHHARTYLHRTAEGRIVELPVAWYPEKGGYWAMNPGYDRPDHQDFRRQITYECMFCHSGYPEISPGADASGGEPIFPGRIPEGIDCQRCHGPGRDHLEAVASGNPEAVRRMIVNPARLGRERQLEICMQCHLETTSFRLPHSILRYDRGAFSFRPGEALADYVLHFDHPPGAHDDKFEIAHQAYRLRKSACFQKSKGLLTCTTCHNPHDAPRGDQAARHYTAVCRRCHGAALEKLVAANRHTASGDCLGCHMPRRRTDDVVHVVMTDHYIQRNKPRRDLLAPRAERHDADETAYQGEVVLYYPPPTAPAAGQELYLAVAQVKQSSNVQAGITRLQEALRKHRPQRGEFYFELAEAFSKMGEVDKAIRFYEEALRRTPDFRPALHHLGKSLAKSGELARAVEVLRKAVELGDQRATVLNDLGLVHLQQGRPADAVAAFRKAIEIDPDHPEAYNNLGGALGEIGDRAGAEEAYRNAVRMQPDFAGAHKNLANLLAAKGDFAQARRHYEKAIQQDPKFAVARFDYGVALAQKEMFDKAREQFEAAVRLDPNFAEAHNGLGDMLAMTGDTARAIRHYRRAVEVKPDFAAAHFSLGSALAAQGKRSEAIFHLQKAAESPEEPLRQAARDSLKAVGGPQPPP